MIHRAGLAGVSIAAACVLPLGAGAAANPCTDVNDDGLVDGSDIAVIRTESCWRE